MEVGGERYRERRQKGDGGTKVSWRTDRKRREKLNYYSQEIEDVLLSVEMMWTAYSQLEVTCETSKSKTLTEANLPHEML